MKATFDNRGLVQSNDGNSFPTFQFGSGTLFRYPENVEIYVNSSTGSDTNTGAANSPIASFAEALSRIPPVYRGYCRVLFASGTYTLPTVSASYKVGSFHYSGSQVELVGSYDVLLTGTIDLVEGVQQNSAARRAYYRDSTKTNLIPNIYEGASIAIVSGTNLVITGVPTGFTNTQTVLENTTGSFVHWGFSGGVHLASGSVYEVRRPNVTINLQAPLEFVDSSLTLSRVRFNGSAAKHILRFINSNVSVMETEVLSASVQFNQCKLEGTSSATCPDLYLGSASLYLQNTNVGGLLQLPQNGFNNGSIPKFVIRNGFFHMNGGTMYRTMIKMTNETGNANGDYASFANGATVYASNFEVTASTPGAALRIGFDRFGNVLPINGATFGMQSNAGNPWFRVCNTATGGNGIAVQNNSALMFDIGTQITTPGGTAVIVSSGSRFLRTGTRELVLTGGVADLVIGSQTVTSASLISSQFLFDSASLCYARIVT